MRAATALLALLACFVAAACGGGGTGSSGSTPASGTATPAPVATDSAPTSVPTSTAKPRALQGEYVVVTTCDSMTRNLQFVDPGGDRPTVIRSFTLDPSQASLADCEADDKPGRALRSAFDGLFLRLAVQQGPADDGTYRTGTTSPDITPGESGAFTDLSGLSATDSRGGEPAKQSPGAFAPDGSLFFVQNDHGDGRLMRVKPAGGTPQFVRTLGGFFVTSEGTDDASRLFFNGGSLPKVYDPARREAACEDGWAFWSFDDWTRIAYGKPQARGRGTQDARSTGVNPVACIDHRTYISFSSFDDMLYRVTIAGGHVKTEKMMMPMGGDVTEPVLSDDGSQIVFVHRFNGVNTLYTVPVASRRPVVPKPLSVSGLPTSEIKIISWQQVGSAG